ncbi:hypothetical protein LTR86_001285 [Recurvomyces mirabilis]|nr:hypothetical protein LTR86_001285 [Recurvomyces mirabilis]
MALKIFITGATGYIGGDTLHNLYAKHPDHQYTALVRTKDKAAIVEKAYPNVQIVIGDLDNSELLEEQASKANVVLRMSTIFVLSRDDTNSVQTLPMPLITQVRRKRLLLASSKDILETPVNPDIGFTLEDSEAGRLGEHSDKEYNDWTAVDELTHLPASAFHRNVDEIVLETGEKHGDVVRTAIVCPPTIYGKGRGPVATRSRQAYELTKLILTGKYIPVVGSGKARWNNVHVSDLASLFTLLVEEAGNPTADKQSELWGSKGYYLAENGEHVWTDLAVRIGQECTKQGYTSNLEKKSLTKEAALDQAGFEAVSWGWNSRGKAERAKHLLGWKPSCPSIEAEVPNMVQEEHDLLSKKA